MGVHTHTLTFTITAANNNPSYYQYEVIYCDLTTWETTDRTLPAGAVVLSDTSLSWSALTRETAPDSKLIKLGTFGSTGGQDNHNHPVSVSLASTNPSVSGIPYSDYSSVGSANHSHTGSLTTSDKSIKPARIQTRLYSVTQATDRIEAGVIAFVDGTPSSNWTVLSWNDNFIESANQNAVATGVSSHDHINLSLTSSTYTKSTSSTGGMNNSVACNNHTHNVTFSLDSQAHLPPYVYLYPVKLNTTLYHINAYTATHVDDVLLRKAYDTSTITNARFKSAGYEFMTPDVVMKKVMGLDLPIDTALGARLAETFNVDSITLARNHRSWLSSLRLIITTAAISAGIRLVQPYQATYPVLDSILKAWTTQIDKIYMKISTMDLSNKLDFATGNEIDAKWGAVYDLPRFAGESDDHYRKRIKTYTLIQTGSGTKNICEAVLDEIVDEPGASRVETHEPGKIRIHWQSNTAPKVAASRSDVIDYTVPMMLAAGIFWEMFLEYVELLVGLKLQGTDYVDFYIDFLVQSKDKTGEYYVRPRLMNRGTKGITADAILKSRFNKIFIANLRAQGGFYRSFAADGLLLRSCHLSLPFDLLEKANPTHVYRMGQHLQRLNIGQRLLIDSLLKKLIRRTLHMMFIAVFQNHLETAMDVGVLRYDINKLCPLDSLFKKGLPTESAMDLLLVSA